MEIETQMPGRVGRQLHQNTHKIIHENLLDKMADFHRSILMGTLDVEELFIFLRMWLKSHIKGVDRRYGEELGLL